MRRKIIAGNWKMHGTQAVVTELARKICNGIYESSAFINRNCDIVLIPAFIHLISVATTLKSIALAFPTPTANNGVRIALGAQNLYPGSQGAFTGEVSGLMLVDAGCNYVLIGHSERRALFGESLDLIATKCQQALAANLTPILCVGETKAERESECTKAVIEEQILSVTAVIGPEGMQQLVIAYEPVWAIGTGLSATPQQAEEVHAYIRELIATATHSQELAARLPLLYGGSLKPENAAELFSQPNIDGGLIGGAALDARSFLAICEKIT